MDLPGYSFHLPKPTAPRKVEIVKKSAKKWNKKKKKRIDVLKILSIRPKSILD